MPIPVSLDAPEAACLEALRSGISRKVLIALRAGLNLLQTIRALKMLAALELAVIDDRRTWHITRRGKTANISIAPAVRRRGRKSMTTPTPGASAARLLELLDRPRRGAELAKLLGVTRQRVHQLVFALSALGLIRFADAAYPTFVIAHKDDPSTLLRPDQERVLSAFPEIEATTLSKIALVLQTSAAKLAAIAEYLLEAGLIERTGVATYGDLYRLTATGSGNWQRSATMRHADLPPLPFRSDRVRAVLSYFECQGPIRTRDVGAALGISQTSINALVQYLKRKNMVRTHTNAHHAPHELTPEGREMLVSMQMQGGTAPRRDIEAVVLSNAA
jgi:DNA-binding MarR family transcriptional regulator